MEFFFFFFGGGGGGYTIMYFLNAYTTKNCFRLIDLTRARIQSNIDNRSIQTMSSLSWDSQSSNWLMKKQQHKVRIF